MVREILAGAGYVLPPPSAGTPGSGGTVQVGYMRMGMAGGIVKFLQELLIGLGYSCGSTGADSMFGPATDGAVRAFQGDRGLVVDGIFGPASMHAMSVAYATVRPGPTPPPPPAPGSGVPGWPGRFLLLSEPMMQGGDVRTWQQQMANRGWGISPDGWYGKQTLTICKSFQSEKGLKTDGVIGMHTWNAAWTAPVTP
jgi:peptidoglycan hydrolase-like protein with peptidoglycan-binding domain